MSKSKALQDMYDNYYDSKRTDEMSTTIAENVLKPIREVINTKQENKSKMTQMNIAISIKVKEVKVSPDVYDMLKLNNTISYDADNEKMMWGKYEVSCSTSVEDIDFVFDVEGK